MDKHEKNKLKMYKAVEAICTAYQAEWNGLPAFVNAFDAFTTKLQELDQAAYNQGIAIAGITANRDQLLDTTVDKAEVIANALRVLASATNDQLLAGQLDFSKSELRRGGSEQTLQFLERILNNANHHVFDLNDYGIEQEDIDELDGLRLQLVDTIGTPRNAIIDRKQHTRLIDDLTAELDDLLRNYLDRLIEVLRPDSPAFCKRFKDARIIVDYKGKKHDDGGDEDEPDLGGNPGSEGTR